MWALARERTHHGSEIENNFRLSRAIELFGCDAVGDFPTFKYEGEETP
jgi:hypothetical protein